MVVTTCVLCCKHFAKKSIKRIKRPFLDSLRVHVAGGAGGMGNPKYGGVGGGGGNVYAVGTPETTLRNIVQKFPTKRVAACSGDTSHKNYLVGRPGNDVSIDTPLGVSIFNEAGRKLGNIDKEGDQVLLARGGLGGCKESGFNGERGESGIITFDLKLIADVGLVGFPNAGKSTLLSAVSKAQPKIASYPFTTLHPQLGTIEYPDLRQVTVADLPGLIEGAHINIGLGHKFLKHVERTKLLTLVVDVGGFQLSPKHKPRGCLETIILLNKELEIYREDLVDIPAILVINKMDKPGSEKILSEIHEAANNLEDVFHQVPDVLRPNQALNFKKIFGISAVKKAKEELDLLTNSIREILDSEIDNVVEDELEFVIKMQRKHKEQGSRMI